MSRWAIVIGVDRYWKPDYELRGAVRDALKMRDWLLEERGGGVPEANLTLLASPLKGKRRPKGSIDATKDNIVQAIAELMERSGGAGERFTFYFAGHGFAARQDFTDEQALVATDFTDLLTDNSITLRSLWDFVETKGFEDQFFFVDACRNPWAGERVVGRWPVPAQRKPGQPPVQQFTLYATSPGLTATELRPPGEEHGAFTESLLRALAGLGPAKAWSSEDATYKVRWDSAVRAVKREFDERLMPGGAGFQIPQAVAKSGVLDRDSNPVLVEFPGGAFDAEELCVFLDPESVVSTAQVAVIDRDAGSAVAESTTISELPVTFRLAPNTYSLRASAPQHDVAIARPPVELYGRVEVRLRLVPTAGDGADGAPAERSAPPAAGAAPTGTLVARSPDSLATVEVTDGSGAILGVGDGAVELGGLGPGFYRARLRTPDGQVVDERLVELAAGEREEVDLRAATEASSPVAERVIEAAELPRHDDNSVEVSERVGPVAAADVSTLLTVGAALQIQKDTGHRLDRLGMSALASLPDDSEAGLYVVFAAEGESERRAAERVSRLSVRAWRFGERVPRERRALQPFSSVAGLGELAVQRPVGAQWVAVAGAGRKPFVVVTACLPGRLTLLVVVREAGGAVRTFQYQPALGRDASSDPQFLRRLEAMQRAYLGNRLDLGHESAAELLDGKWLDPLAGCLGAYLLLRLGDVERLEVPVANLTGQYPGLSDVHVLRAQLEAARGNADGAAAAAAAAIAAGIPLFADGLALLLDALSEYRLDHRNARLLSHVFDRRVKDSLWSVWVPDSIRAGRLLVP